MVISWAARLASSKVVEVMALDCANAEVRANAALKKRNIFFSYKT